MDYYRCFEDHCRHLAAFYCQCGQSPIFVCPDHISQHMATPGHHCITKILRQPTQQEREGIQHAICQLVSSTRRAVESELTKTNEAVSDLLRQVNQLHARCWSNIHQLKRDMQLKTAQLEQFARVGLSKVDGRAYQRLDESTLATLRQSFSPDTLQASFATLSSDTEEEEKTAPQSGRSRNDDSHPLKASVQRLDNQPSSAEALHNVALVQQAQGEYNKAIQSMKECIEMSRQLGLKALENSSLFTLGNLYTELEQYPEAIAAYTTSVDLCRTLSEPVSLANTLFNLGNVQSRLCLFEDCILVLQEAAAESRRLHLFDNLKKSLRCLARAYQQVDLPPSSLECYQELIQVCTDCGERTELARAQGELGSFYHNNCCYSEATSTFRKCIELSKQTGDHELLGQVLEHLGLSYLAQNLSNEASVAFLESIRVQENSGLHDGLAQTYTFLAKAYYSMGRTQEANEALQKATTQNQCRSLPDR